jgi:hypothetical protein
VRVGPERREQSDVGFSPRQAGQELLDYAARRLGRLGPDHTLRDDRERAHAGPRDHPVADRGGELDVLDARDGHCLLPGVVPEEDDVRAKDMSPGAHDGQVEVDVRVDALETDSLPGGAQRLDSIQASRRADRRVFDDVLHGFNGRRHTIRKTTSHRARSAPGGLAERGSSSRGAPNSLILPCAESAEWSSSGATRAPWSRPRSWTG